MDKKLLHNNEEWESHISEIKRSCSSHVYFQYDDTMNPIVYPCVVAYSLEQIEGSYSFDMYYTFIYLTDFCDKEEYMLTNTLGTLVSIQ